MYVVRRDFMNDVSSCKRKTEKHPRQLKNCCLSCINWFFLKFCPCSFHLQSMSTGTFFLQLLQFGQSSPATGLGVPALYSIVVAQSYVECTTCLIACFSIRVSCLSYIFSQLGVSVPKGSKHWVPSVLWIVFCAQASPDRNALQPWPFSQKHLLVPCL